MPSWSADPCEETILSIVLGPAVAGACLAGLAAAALFFAPVSPLVEGQAEAALGRGLAEQAAASYAELGLVLPERVDRVRALERAAALQSLELTDAEEARRLLKLRLALGGAPEELAAVREELAETHLAERHPEAASRQFVAAHDAHPESDRAAQRLIRAAELRIEQPKQARSLWRKLMKEHPDHAGRANLGLGELSLAAGRPASALSPFQAASRSPDEAVSAAARLGLAACYERLGELDGALAELDQSALPEAVRERRKAGLRERASVRDSGR